MLNIKLLICLTETFTLEIENDIELIDRQLLQMVEACKELHHLDINASLDTSTVDSICHLQQEGKICESNLQSFTWFKL